MKITFSPKKTLLLESGIFDNKIQLLTQNNTKIVIRSSGGNVNVSYAGKGQIKGALKLDRDQSDGPCNLSYRVARVDATKGFGPLLYEIALQFLKRFNNTGISPDRDEVSPDAIGVWQRYKERSDIEKKQLDSEKNTLTLRSADNCKQDSYVKAKGDYTKNIEDWKVNPLSFTYKATNTDLFDSLVKSGVVVMERYN